MKIILPLTLFLSFISFSQVGDAEVIDKAILVGTASRNQKFHPKLQYRETSDGRYYTLSYINAKYSNISDIKYVHFYATQEDIDYIYNFLKDGYGNDERRTLKVGDATLSTKKTVSKKSIAVLVIHNDEPDGFFYVIDKQLDRLFGKSQK